MDARSIVAVPSSASGSPPDGGGRTEHLAARQHCADHAELVMRVALWLQATDALVRSTTKQRALALQHAFGCSRATAYRWLASWRAATGQADPKRGRRGFHMEHGTRATAGAHP